MISAIDRINELADGVLYLMLVTEARVTHDALPEIAMPAVLLERPFVAIGHDEHHRPATSVGYHRLECIDSMPLPLPRIFASIDAVDQIEDGHGVVPALGHVDIYAATELLDAAVPRAMDDLRRCDGDRIGGPGA